MLILFQHDSFCIDLSLAYLFYLGAADVTVCQTVSAVFSISDF